MKQAVSVMKMADFVTLATKIKNVLPSAAADEVYNQSFIGRRGKRLNVPSSHVNSLFGPPGANAGIWHMCHIPALAPGGPKSETRVPHVPGLCSLPKAHAAGVGSR